MRAYELAESGPLEGHVVSNTRRLATACSTLAASLSITEGQPKTCAVRSLHLLSFRLGPMLADDFWRSTCAIDVHGVPESAPGRGCRVGSGGG